MSDANQERERLFREAIAKVCTEHGAEMEITDDGKPYGMASPILRVTFETKRDENDEIVADFFSFEW